MTHAHEMSRSIPAVLLSAALTGCVFYTSRPPERAALSAVQTVAVVMARPPKQLFLASGARTDQGKKAEVLPERQTVPSSPFARELGVAAAFAAIGVTLSRLRVSSAELSEKLGPSAADIADAWNEALVRELRDLGFNVIELSAQSAPEWPRDCPQVSSKVDAVIGVELSAGFVSSGSLKPTVGAGVRVTSMECRRTLFSPMYFYGPGSPAAVKDHPNMFLPADPGIEFNDEPELFASLPRAAFALRTGAATLAAHFARQLAR